MGVERWTKVDKPLRIMRVEMIPISMVHPHEAVIDQEVEEFCNSLTSKGVFYRPILLDKKTYVVLDGHHRLAGLQKIGAKKIPSILLDYDDDEIELYTWFPVVWSTEDEIASFLSKSEKIEWMPFEEAKELVESKEAAFCSMTTEGKDSMVLYGNGEKILEDLIGKYSVEYVDTLDFLDQLDHKKGVMLYRRAPKKSEVISMALEGKVFAPKTTRHYLPFRYQDIRVKLTHLF